MTTQTQCDLLADCVRRAMEEWPGYQESDDIIVRDVGGRMLFIGYMLQANYHWHANIQGGIFYLLKIKLPEALRGQGLGDKLYKCIEQAAKDCGCTEIRQTPAGWTKTGETRLSYLKRRGWIEESHEVYKAIEQ